MCKLNPEKRDPGITNFLILKPTIEKSISELELNTHM